MEILSSLDDVWNEKEAGIIWIGGFSMSLFYSALCHAGSGLHVRITLFTRATYLHRRECTKALSVAVTQWMTCFAVFVGIKMNCVRSHLHV